MLTYCQAFCGMLSRYRHGMFAMAIVLFSVEAQARLHCGSAKGSTGTSWFEGRPPADLAIPASTPNNRIIWESPPITISGFCWNARARERLSLWINPDNGSASPHLALGVRYGGQMVTYYDNQNYLRLPPLPTNVTFGGSGYHPFSVTFTYVLIKKTDIPANGATVHLPLIQLDSYDRSSIVDGSPRVRFLVTGGLVRVPSGTCHLSVGDRSKTIMLPTVSSGRLSQNGSTTGRVRFTVKVDNCNVSLRTARFSFTGTPSSHDARYFANTGTAAGVDLRLSTDADVTITPAPAANVVDVVLAAQRGELPLVAEYVRTAELMPGTLRARATIAISYH